MLKDGKQDLLKNYITLKTHLIPTDPKKSFLPFVKNLIVIKEIKESNYTTLSKNFEEYYGFKLPLFIITDILNVLVDSKLAIKKMIGYEFRVSKIRESGTFDQVQINKYSNDVDTLVDDFIVFIDDNKLYIYNDEGVMSEVDKDTFDRVEIEESILAFIKRNDFDLIQNGDSNFSYDKVLDFFLADFVNHSRKYNRKAFNTILKMSEGNLIKSFIFDEVDSTDIYKNTKVFIDTPIVFKLLGFNGEFVQEEYEFLFSSWKNQGGNFYIFNHNYDECLRILRTAQEYVERKEIDLSKTSEVCLFFREKGFTSDDIEMIINGFRDSLDRYGITEHNIDFNNNQENMEDYREIKDLIREQYSHYNTESPFYTEIDNENFIDVDVKSIIYSYYLRENNNIHSFKELKFIYLTNNKGIYYAAKKYQNSHYGETISPLQIDTFIGKVICSNNLNNISKVAENRIISHCLQAFSPSNILLKTFESFIGDLKNKDTITAEDYYLLKNSKVVNYELVKKTKGNPKNLNEDTILEFLNTVRAELIAEEISKHKLEKEELEKNHVENIKSKEKEIVEIKKGFDDYVDNEKKKRKSKFDKNVNEELIKYEKICRVLVLIITMLIGLPLLILYLIKIFSYNENDIFFLIMSLVLVVPFAYHIYCWVRNDTKYLRKVLDNQKLKIQDKYKDIL